MKLSTLLLTVLSGGGIVPLFSDTFAGTTINTAKWTETDPESVISQNDELIIASGGSGGASTNYLTSVMDFSPQAGMALIWRHGAISGGTALTRFGNNAVGVSDAQAELASTEAASYWRPVSNFIQLRQAWGDGDWAAWVLLSGRSHLLHKPSGGDRWRRVFTSPQEHPDFGQTNAKARLQRNTSSVSARWKQFDVTTITQALYDPLYNSGGTLAAGTVLSIPADGFIQFLWTATAGTTHDFMFRRDSDTDTLSLVLDQNGTGTNTAFRLIRRNAGDSTIANPITTLTAGTQYRVSLRCAGSQIVGWIVAASGGNTSSSFVVTETHNQTSVGGKINTTDLDDLKVWSYEV